MSDSANKPRRGPVILTELVGKVLAPMASAHGLALAHLITAWPEIVGARYAGCTRPDKIIWPRGRSGGERAGEPALLVLKVDGPRAVLVQHESSQIIEKVNSFLGYGAIGQLRIVQGPVGSPNRAAPAMQPLGAEAENQLAGRLSGVRDDGLRAALDRLGRGVLGGQRSPGHGRGPP